ncbi:hypothetical protein Alg215_12512, partial [Pyrenophora tritici-repentis]
DMEVMNWGYTHISVKEFCYVWTIRNFSPCIDGIRRTITSPVFSLEANDEVTWCLRAHPNGVDESGFKKFLPRDLLLSHRNCLLPEDQLTICCKVTILGRHYNIP